MTSYRGYEAKLYRGAAGSTATTEVINAIDAECAAPRPEFEDTTRKNGKFASWDVGHIQLSLSFKMLVDPSDADYLAVRNAFLNGTAIALKYLSGTDGKGWDADWKIVEFSDAQPLDGDEIVNVRARPSGSLRNPAAV